MTTSFRLAVYAVVSIVFGSSQTWSQARPTSLPESALVLSTDSVGPVRFVAVHGRQSAILGYPKSGLEMWAWPFQILRGYRISIRPQGATSEMEGELLLRRIDYRPDAVTRIYIGSDYVIRETFFVPLDSPGAIITYEVQGRGHVDISIHFTPVLDLMWPASVGGQSTSWSDAASGYVLSDGAARLRATIHSPDTISHDSTENSTIHYGDGLSFAIRPNPSAHVFIGLDKSPDPETTVKRLAADETEMERQTAEHYENLIRDTLQIETPDKDLNRALAWSSIALDQAWVCNPDLGCGMVAGYGPSRSARRPQYAWFFAGDGLIAMDGLVAEGQYDRARAELEFILKYQDKKTGMIWHELSQSAGQIDWVGKYPYMFVHVDITFQFLSALSGYVEASGDTDFAKQHWPELESAYRYCQSVIDPATNLPHIPSDKEGGNEQDRESDELGLSASWLDASSAFSELARWASHPQEADKGILAVEQSRKSIATRYWDSGRKFWISGHTANGKEIFDERSQPSELISEHVFSAEQDDTLLNKIASSDFQTDWGSRGLSSASDAFSPDSYAKGSVFALNTTGVAETFWNEHRPTTAFPIWSSIVPWTSLDSLGHIHEVLAGDYYQQQTESVPEQTWSSAGFISAATRGLLGLRIDSVSNEITFSPHMPPEWHEVTVRNVRMQHAALDLDIRRDEESIHLKVMNRGQSASLVFAPQIPLGARLLGAQCDGHRVTVSLERNAQDEHARIAFTATGATTECDIQFRDGVEVVSAHLVPLVGTASNGTKITAIGLKDSALIVDADVNVAGSATFEVKTHWEPSFVEGGAIHMIGPNHYKVEMDRDKTALDHFGYSRRRVIIHFEEKTVG